MDKQKIEQTVGGCYINYLLNIPGGLHYSEPYSEKHQDQKAIFNDSVSIEGS